LSYLPEKEKPAVKRRFQRAYACEKYTDAKAEFIALGKDLEGLNASATKSLNEGLEDLLTLHRLELNTLFERSFSTTNCIENVNSQLEKYLRKVRSWKNSMQRHRWVAAALLEMEPKMRKVNNYVHLEKMRNAIKNEIKRKDKESDSQISTKNGT